MARQYYGFINTLSGTVYRVEIWDDPSGSATGGTELPLANEGLSFSYDGNGNTLWDGNLQASRATAEFIVTETADHTFFQNLAVEYEDKFALIVYKDNVLHYVGRILADQMQYERRPELNTIYSVVGVDGIALLRNYKVQYSWFDATTERLSILDLINNSINETNLPDYYDHLGYGNEYLIDAAIKFPSGATAPNEYVNYLEINWASVINNLDSYMNLNSIEGSPRLYKKTDEVIEEVLRTLGCRLIYSNGYFWIYDPIMLANNTGTNYIKYATDGTRVSKEAYTIQMPVDDGQRPCFSAFPILTHQPPVKSISQTFDRVSFNRVVRESNSPSTAALELRTPSIGWVSGEERSLFVRSQIKFAAQSFTGIPPMQTYSEINFRIYVDIGFGTNPYLKYNYQTQVWDPVPTKPFFEKVRCDVSDAEVVNSRITIFTIDFDREFKPPNYEDEVVIEISVGNLQWNFTSGSITNAVLFWGSLYMVERDATQRSITATNTKNTGASEIVELNSTYGYNFTGYSLKGIGTIWNSDTGGASTISMGDWAENQLAVYVEAPLSMSGQLVDAGDYFPTKIAYLDSNAFIFNGGTFNAQSEIWDVELLKIAQDITSVTLSYDDYVDYIDINDQQGDSLRRSLLQTNQLRESVSNIPNWMQYDIVRLSPSTPTTTPSQSTDFGVKINYNPTNNLLSWDIQELGKSVTYTAGTTALDVDAELIICDTSAGDVEVTLPDADTVKGRKYTFKKIESLHSVIITGTIDDNGELSFNGKNESATIMSNGTQYYVISRYHQ